MDVNINDTVPVEEKCIYLNEAFQALEVCIFPHFKLDIEFYIFVIAFYRG